MNDTEQILAGISRLETKLDALSHEVSLLRNAAKPAKSLASRILDAAPTEEQLDRIEVEEHAKVMCTYPAVDIVLGDAG